MRRWLPALLLAWPAAAQELAGHGGPVRALAVLPGAVASGGFDQAVILWDPGAGRARRLLRWHGGAVNALAALPGGGFASAGEDARIALWGEAEEPLRVFEGHTEPVAALAVAPDGTLGSAGWDGTVRLWAPDGTARVLEGHQGQVNGIAWADGAWVSAGYDGTLRAWPEGRVLAEFGVPQAAVVALPGGVAAGGAGPIAAGGAGRIAAGGAGRIAAGGAGPIAAGGAGRIAAGGVDGVVRLIAADGAVRELAAGSRPVVGLAASPDGALLAAASLGGSVTLWSVAEARLLHTLEGPGLPVWSVAFDADGRSLWTGGQDRRVRRWDVATGAPVGPLAPEAEAAVPAGADPEGARVFRACSACHALAAEAGPMAGPHLHGLFGRRMGSVPGYRYSARLAAGDMVWTPETVGDLFTRGPDVVTPGTRMPVQRVGNPEELAALLRFLEVATR